MGSLEGVFMNSSQHLKHLVFSFTMLVWSICPLPKQAMVVQEPMPDQASPCQCHVLKRRKDKHFNKRMPLFSSGVLLCSPAWKGTRLASEFRACLPLLGIKSMSHHAQQDYQKRSRSKKKGGEERERRKKNRQSIAHRSGSHV